MQKLNTTELLNSEYNLAKKYCPYKINAYIRIESRNIFQSDDDIELLDKFVEHCGFYSLAENWYKRTSNDALSMIQSGFQFDISDNARPLVDENIGIQSANRFTTHFNEPIKYYANTGQNPFAGGWYSIGLTTDSVECGIFIIDNERIGCTVFFHAGS